MPPSVAVLIPCFNEEATVAKVVTDFRAALPDAAIYVYDNNSTDRTREEAAGAGALVRSELLQGKGHVVRRMFADVDADIYVMVDGDGTYDASRAPAMVSKLVDDGLDMVVACRRSEDHQTASRPGHRFGNKIITRTVAWLFGRGFNDMLSGYRVFSRRFAKSFPSAATGFETETEITVHALQIAAPTAEIETRYFPRPEGSLSKLSTFGDGFLILWTILMMLKEVRPFAFFGTVFAVLAVASVLLAVPLIVTYMETGLVPRLPTAVLATGMMLLAFISLTAGLVLDSVSRARLEVKRLAYLSVRCTRHG